MEFLQLYLRDFLMLLMSILIGAIPFVFLGVVFSVVLENLVKTEYLLKIIPKNRWLGSFVMSFIGFLFPVCECGNVPLARRMIRKGIAPSTVVSFLFSAPILNPVTLTSTIVAFSFWPELIWARFLGGFLIAYSAGIFFSFNSEQKLFLMEKEAEASENNTHHCHEDEKLVRNKFLKIIKEIPKEFLEMLGVLILGAAIASLIQIAIPRDLLMNILPGDLGGILMMIFLALIISVCSSIDAFIALAYLNSVSGGALLAFMLFGPLIDLKALALMKTIFNRKTLIYLSLWVFSLTVIFALIFNLF